MKLCLLFFLTILTRLSSFLFGKFDFLLFSVFFLFMIHYLFLLFLDFKNHSIKKRNLILRFFHIIGYLTFITIAVILDTIFNTQEIRELILMTLLYNEIVNIFKIFLSLGIKVPNIFNTLIEELFNTLPKETIPTQKKNPSENDT